MSADRSLDGKRVLVTGGTGSLGQILVRRLLAGELGTPEHLTVFSRDEAKQHAMRLRFRHLGASATDEIIYHNFERRLRFELGDIRDYPRVCAALRNHDVVFNAAAMKQVPACEYFPYEAVQTNIIGAENIVRAIHDEHIAVETVVGISTDKAAKPVNVMGMTKAIQERIFVRANLGSPNTRFVCARYGNVLASRGSVIPLFLNQIALGGPVTVTTKEMTRFLLSLDDAVDTVLAAVRQGLPGDTYVPRIPAARVLEIAEALVADSSIEVQLVGIRPGEKVHEILVSEEEANRTIARGAYYVIRPILPELHRDDLGERPLRKEYSSADHLLPPEGVRELLRRHEFLRSLPRVDAAAAVEPNPLPVPALED